MFKYSSIISAGLKPKTSICDAISGLPEIESGSKNEEIKYACKTGKQTQDAVPGASIAVQMYGDFLNHNPHLHAIVSDG